MKQLPRMRLTQNSPEGLRRREYDLLVLLALNLDAETQALPVSELSNLLQITPAGVTHLLNPLEELGCIQRLPDPNDRRVVLIALTEKGRSIAEGLISTVQSKLIRLVNHLGEEDSQTLVRLMSKMIAFLSEEAE
jgi:DNA-binding MarR family transcriptional regulator